MELDYRIVEGQAAEEVVRRTVRGGAGARADEAVAAFERFAERYGLDLSRQAAAYEGELMAAWCLFLGNRGATGTVMAPQRFEGMRRSDYETAMVELIRLIARQIDAWDLAMIQAMVGDDHSQAVLFERAGYQRLADLMIMEAPVALAEEDVPPIEWLPYEEVGDDRLASAIFETYVESRDCPELTGLRTGSDVIEGHRYSGVFEPQGWWLARLEGGDAGVLLLNSTEEDPSRLELVYMGVAQRFRGRGVGKAILAKAMAVSRELGKRRIRLAVDSRNRAAIGLYRRFGFRPHSHQSVLAVLNEARRDRLLAQG
mgnify:CR=1 FL=1